MNSFSLRNIKGFSDSGTIEIKPITIFVGKNSCGKSSLLRFPVVLSQTFSEGSYTPIQFSGKLVDYGGFEDVLHQNQGNSLSFSVSYMEDIATDNSSILVFFNERAKRNQVIKEVLLDVSIIKEKDNLTVEKLELSIDSNKVCEITFIDPTCIRIKIAYIYKDGGFDSVDYEIETKIVGFTHFFPLIPEVEIIKGIYNSKGKSINDEEAANIYRDYVFGDTKKASLFKKGDNLDKQIRAFFYVVHLLECIHGDCNSDSQKLHYIGPFRKDPQRYYRDSEYQNANVGVSGEQLSDLLISDYHKGGRLINVISESLKSMLDVDLTVKDIGNGLFQIMIVDQTGKERNIIDTGFGLSQVLPIIAQIENSETVAKIKSSTPFFVEFEQRNDKSEETIVIEQPELHLHPAAQSELADLFCKAVTKGKNKKVIFETHSEHIIRKLQVLIANKTITADMVRIYYVDKDENGDSWAKEMKINENGKFAEQWPSGFFDKGYLLSKELLSAGR